MKRKETWWIAHEEIEKEHGRPESLRGSPRRSTRCLERHARDVDHQSGRAHFRQPELADGDSARADAARRLHPAREDHALRPRAHPRAHRARARLGGARLLRAAPRRCPSYTTAKVLTEVGERTPVFARFSTVAGGAGSVDTPRDVRGFAVKFYTKEGNWDLVGNNIPVFFIQDAIKFPDLIHAVKMEPDRGFPQAASAHDTFWDFISLMPESMHMMMWVMSDRTLPAVAAHDRRLRRPQLPAGQRRRANRPSSSSTGGPKLGMQSTVWDEAVKIAGADPDYHRRDLFEAIDAGDFPEWELGVQLFSEAGRGRVPVRPSRCDQADPGGARAAEDRSAAWCSTAGRTTSSPRPSRSRSARRISCRASTSRTIRCCRAGCSRTSTRSCRGSARPTSTSSRSTRRSARSPNQQRDGTCRCSNRRVAWRTSRTRSQRDSARETPSRLSFVCRSARAGERGACGPRASPITTARRGCSIAARRRTSRRTSRRRWCSNCRRWRRCTSARAMVGHLLHIDDNLAQRVADGLALREDARRARDRRAGSGHGRISRRCRSSAR